MTRQQLAIFEAYILGVLSALDVIAGKPDAMHQLRLARASFDIAKRPPWACP